MNEPRRGALAYCSLGYLGLIESTDLRQVTYPDGNKGLAWTGKVLWPFNMLGGTWSSRNPEVVAYVDPDTGKLTT